MKPAEYGEWGRKGATLSDATAEKEEMHYGFYVERSDSKYGASEKNAFWGRL